MAALVGLASLVLLTAPTFLSRVGVSLPMLVPIFLSMVGLVGLLLAAQFERLPKSWLRFRALRLLHDLSGSVRIVFLRPASACSPSLELPSSAKQPWELQPIQWPLV